MANRCCSAALEGEKSEYSSGVEGEKLGGWFIFSLPYADLNFGIESWDKCNGKANLGIGWHEGRTSVSGVSHVRLFTALTGLGVYIDGCEDKITFLSYLSIR